MSYKALSSFIWHCIRPYKWRYLSILIVSLVWSLDSTLWAYLIRLVIDDMTAYDLKREVAWQVLKIPVMAGFSLWLVVELGFRAQGFLLAKTLPELESDIRMKMVEHIQKHSPKYFNEHYAGGLSNKVTDMVTQVSFMLQQILTIFFPTAATCILGVLFFIAVNPLFAALLAGWLVVHFAICIGFSKKCDELEKNHGEVRTTLVGKIVDSFTNNFAVNLFFRFKYEREFIGGFQKLERTASYKAKQYIEYVRVLLGLASLIIGGVGINGYMIYSWLQGKITTGEVVQIFNMTWNISMTIWMTGFIIPQFVQALGISKQAFTVLKDPQDIVDPVNAEPIKITQGEIAFQNVSFFYGAKKLFQNKNIVIKGGQKVGLVGYSGAGKSTFINLILRFFPVTYGKILIDGQDISRVTLESLRQNVALIPQDPILFHRSIKENIVYGKLDATDDEILKVAKLAHCHEFIKRFSEGYDAYVGERGTKLSGGERQRIVIARAMLANAPILILDEATSALDSVTERYIQESLERLMVGKTSIVIAHRLSTLARMDRIIVFEKGKVVEDGSHAELLAKDGHYAKMWKMQAGGFIPDSNALVIDMIPDLKNKPKLS